MSSPRANGATIALTEGIDLPNELCHDHNVYAARASFDRKRMARSTRNLKSSHAVVAIDKRMVAVARQAVLHCLDRLNVVLMSVIRFVFLYKWCRGISCSRSSSDHKVNRCRRESSNPDPHISPNTPSRHERQSHPSRSTPPQAPPSTP